MRIIEWPQFLENGLNLKDELTSMTIGIFDGVHLGHQALIKRIVSYKANNVPAVVTFRQNHKTGSKDIQSFQERLDMLKKLGIKITIVIDFTDEFRQIPGAEFLNLLLKHGSADFFAVGSDFRCGYQLDTDAKAVKNFFASHKIPVEIVPELCHPMDGLKSSLPISSSRIRAAIAAGDIALAEKMLGYTI